MEFSRQQHWTGLPSPTPRDFVLPAVFSVSVDGNSILPVGSDHKLWESALNSLFPLPFSPSLLLSSLPCFVFFLSFCPLFPSFLFFLPSFLSHIQSVKTSCGLYLCYQTQVWLLTTRKPVIGRQGKGKVILFWRSATWAEGGLVSANQLLIAAQRAEAFIGEFQGCIYGGREQDGIRAGWLW